MKSLTSKKLFKTLSLNVLLFFFLTCAACSYEPLTITGTVVDQSGSPLSDVSVWACYSGWGWGKEGSLVWDKDTCSETVQTDTDGMYVISFEGPVSSRLRVRKEGWVQSDSYNTTHSRIVMTKSGDHSARLRNAAKQRELQRSKRKGGETDAEYYCRVVMSGGMPVRLQYLDEVIVVTPTVLEDESQTMAMFAVQGSVRVVNTFVTDLVLLVNGEAQSLNFSAKAVETDCEEDLNFIEFKSQGMAAWGDGSVEFLVPSIKAMFEAKKHASPVE